LRPAVYITFDVECSMGGAWGDPALKPVTPSRGMMGQYGNEAYGLPLIVEILESQGLKATFFLEPFNDELGHRGQTEDISRFLLDHGQDVQLHVHPVHQQYGLKESGQPHALIDDIAALDPQAQIDLLGEGADRIERWTGERPVAFRAGNMGASEETLRNLAAVGIRIDSSYTFPYLGGQCRFADTQRYNGSKWYDDVLEMALSGFLQPNLPGLHPAKPVDLMGISFGECRQATRQISQANADTVLILHSFSLFKVRNRQYDAGRPNRIVTRRFRQFCRWLGEDRDSPPARTFSELAQAVEKGQYEPLAVPPCRLNRPLRAVARKAVQALNRFYRV
jgi:peptidoglycan/xylan/chitin deacetylase (PgdA/CDA1 family)